MPETIPNMSKKTSKLILGSINHPPVMLDSLLPCPHDPSLRHPLNFRPSYGPQMGLRTLWCPLGSARTRAEWKTPREISGIRMVSWWKNLKSRFWDVFGGEDLGDMDRCIPWILWIKMWVWKWLELCLEVKLGCTFGYSFVVRDIQEWDVVNCP